jgi:predicted DNA-binding protein
MIRTQIQLTEQQAERLHEIARREGVSVAELIRRAVDTLEATGTRSEKHLRAVGAVGRFRSGDKTLARQHDRALAEAYRR